MGVVEIVVIAVVLIISIIIIISIVRGTSPKGMEKKLTKMANTAIRTQNSIINSNEEILKETADKMADIHKDAIKTTVHAVKEGWTEDETIYCKYCGAQIDSDSTFCKKCGKEI